MLNYFDTVQNQSGTPVAGASVSVYFAGTTSPATLYSDNGVTTTANPVTTDALGRFSFYVANGRYDLAVTATNVTPYTVHDQAIYDSSTFVEVAFSATPNFNLAVGNQEITLTGNVTGATVSNLTAGQFVWFKIVQDSVGGRTFTWPGSVLNAPTVNSAANGVTLQAFISDGTSLYALAPGSYAS